MSLSGVVGSALNTVLGPITGAASSAASAVASAGLNAIGSWVLGGTESALRTVAGVIGSATAPNLESTWFSSAYWRVAALAAMLTVPFLFAAAIQALVRSDLALLLRSAFLYMPLSLIAVGLAAPVTTLLLAATDQMSAAVSAVGVQGGATFLDRAAGAASAYAAAAGSPFFVVVIGLFALMAALALAIEMLVREAAVYVVVLMLPLGFAAMVWPARRIWATRLIELLVSLILSKFVIVAVLSLAGSAFANGSSGISELLVAMALVMLSVFAPWTLMRILPFTELAAGAAGALRRDLPVAAEHSRQAMNAGLGLVDPALGLAAKLGLGSAAGRTEEAPLTSFADEHPATRPSAGLGSEPADLSGSDTPVASASASSGWEAAPSRAEDDALLSLGGGEAMAAGGDPAPGPGDDALAPLGDGAVVARADEASIPLSDGASAAVGGAVSSPLGDGPSWPRGENPNGGAGVDHARPVEIDGSPGADPVGEPAGADPGGPMDRLWGGEGWQPLGLGPGLIADGIRNPSGESLTPVYDDGGAGTEELS